MRKNEIIGIVVIVIIAIVSIFFVNNKYDAHQKNIMITVDNELYKNIAFDDKTQDTHLIETQYGTNLLVIKNGNVSIVKADCPAQICVHTKAASNLGDMIVCLPHKLVVEITEQGR